MGNVKLIAMTDQKREVLKTIVVQQEPLKVLFTWTAPERVFKKRDPEFFRTIFTLLILIVIILLFAQMFILVLAIIATAFLAYALNTVPPQEVQHQITTQGIIIAGYTYEWKVMRGFFFTSKDDYVILNIDLLNKFPGRLLLIIQAKDKELITQILSHYISFQANMKETWLDQASRWLSEKVPLER